MLVNILLLIILALALDAFYVEHELKRIERLLHPTSPTQRCCWCGNPHTRRNVRHDSISAFCTNVCHDRAMA